MEIMMAPLERMFEPFREFGISNLDVHTNGKFGKFEDKEELEMEPEKERLRSTSHCPILSSKWK
jgi:hypothetical protein